jgi:hypothetical protein
LYRAGRRGNGINLEELRKITNICHDMRFQVIMAVSMKMSAFWNIAMCTHGS